VSILRMTVLVAIVAACASTRIPSSGDANVAMTAAERGISDASAAGADSLSAGMLGEARAGLEAARAATAKDPNRAALLARRALADAAYAKAIAERVLADRQRAAAQLELSRVPPPGDMP